VPTPASAEAATITVDTTADEHNADGDCSLREAIIATLGGATGCDLTGE
jgi:CSLREA domain-containing protein